MSKKSFREKYPAELFSKSDGHFSIWQGIYMTRFPRLTGGARLSMQESGDPLIQEKRYDRVNSSLHKIKRQNKRQQRDDRVSG